MSESWDKYFLSICDVVASKSKDPSTKVGCVIVGPSHEIRSTGFNGMPKRVWDGHMELIDRDTKLLMVEHAERNAIYQCAFSGVSTAGCTLYVNSLPPCADCARAIIQSGIVEVVMNNIVMPERWKKSCEKGWDMMRETGLIVRYVGPDLNTFLEENRMS